MKRALLILAGLALVLGAYVQETGGKVESLPVAVQPYARRMHEACEPAIKAVLEKIALLTDKLTPSRRWNSDAVKRCETGRAPSPNTKESTRVIAYADGQDLLRQLRGVPAGTKIDFRSLETKSAPVSTGISCSDKAAKAAYMERKDKEMNELNRDIKAEMDRIQQAPGSRR